jgi:hypothetical protein
MTNALTQRAYQTPLSRDRITARCRAFGPPTELPELNCWSIEKHAGHLASCNSLRMSVANPLWGASTELLKLKFSIHRSCGLRHQRSALKPGLRSVFGAQNVGLGLEWSHLIPR